MVIIMEYNEVNNYIQSLRGRGIVLGLDDMKKLLKKLNNPESKLNIIHIAGTNGKGSVGAYISSVLQCSQKKVARFVSPCVGEYENTFLINSKPVAHDVIGRCADVVKKAIDELECEGVYPTSFLAETALSLVIFRELMPDYAIIECGMGGKDDATNAIDDITLSVITKISLDHTRFLGSTIREIATAKAGIIRENTPVVSAIQQKDAEDVIKCVCDKLSAPLHIADHPKIQEMTDTYTSFFINSDIFTTKMLGVYQPQNASLAICASRVLGICDNAIKRGIYNAQWGFRFERTDKYILDGAHNPDGADMLAKSLSVYTSPRDTAFVCACFKDKDYQKIARITSMYADCVYCVKAPTERGLDADILRQAFSDCGVMAYASPTLEDALKSASAYKNVVVFGTLSILSEAKDIIERFNNNAAL